MASYITTLKDNTKTNDILPRTSLKAVSDDNGNYLDSQLTASDVNALKNGKISSMDSAISAINSIKVKKDQHWDSISSNEEEKFATYHYERADTTDYNLPYENVQVWVSKAKSIDSHESMRGVALATSWSESQDSKIWVNSLHADKNNNQWWGWREIRTVVESGTSSTHERWYNLYTDGWLEQGGCTQVSLLSKNTIYSWNGLYLKPFNSGSFVHAQVTITSGWIYEVFGGAEEVTYNAITGYIKSTSESNTYPRTAKIYWRVYGYL